MSSPPQLLPIDNVDIESTMLESIEKRLSILLVVVIVLAILLMLYMIVECGLLAFSFYKNKAKTDEKSTNGRNLQSIVVKKSGSGGRKKQRKSSKSKRSGKSQSSTKSRGPRSAAAARKKSAASKTSSALTSSSSAAHPKIVANVGAVGGANVAPNSKTASSEIPQPVTHDQSSKNGEQRPNTAASAISAEEAANVDTARSFSSAIELPPAELAAARAASASASLASNASSVDTQATTLSLPSSASGVALLSQQPPPRKALASQTLVAQIAAQVLNVITGREHTITAKSPLTTAHAKESATSAAVSDGVATALPIAKVRSSETTADTAIGIGTSGSTITGITVSNTSLGSNLETAKCSIGEPKVVEPRADGTAPLTSPSVAVMGINGESLGTPPPPLTMNADNSLKLSAEQMVAIAGAPTSRRMVANTNVDTNVDVNDNRRDG